MLWLYRNNESELTFSSYELVALISAVSQSTLDDVISSSSSAQSLKIILYYYQRSELKVFTFLK